MPKDAINRTGIAIAVEERNDIMQRSFSFYYRCASIKGISGPVAMHVSNVQARQPVYFGFAELRI